MCPLLFYGVGFNLSMAFKILEAYEGTLEKDSPIDNERYEHSEMLIYKVNM
jgi:peptide alpha-N-acetyltransferase